MSKGTKSMHVCGSIKLLNLFMIRMTCRITVYQPSGGRKEGNEGEFNSDSSVHFIVVCGLALSASHMYIGSGQSGRFIADRTLFHSESGTHGINLDGPDVMVPLPLFGNGINLQEFLPVLRRSRTSPLSEQVNRSRCFITRCNFGSERRFR